MTVHTSTYEDIHAGYTQSNPFIGAKRKRVPAVIRQTGCIIDHGIEFSVGPFPSVTPYVLLHRSLTFHRSLSSSLTYGVYVSSLATPPYVPLRQLDMNATRLLLMHRDICILRIRCIKLCSGTPGDISSLKEWFVIPFGDITYPRLASGETKRRKTETVGERWTHPCDIVQRITDRWNICEQLVIVGRCTCTFV